MFDEVRPAAKSAEAEGREFLMSTFTHDPDALGAKVLSVALIGPQEQRRRAVANALAGSQASVTREFLPIRSWTICRACSKRATTSSSWSWIAIPEQALDIGGEYLRQ